MEELCSTNLNPSQIGLFYKVLQSGGFIKIDERFGVKVDKYDKFFRVSIVVSGRKIEQKIYFNGMQSSYKKKPKTVKEERKKTEKVVSKNETRAGEVDLFKV